MSAKNHEWQADAAQHQAALEAALLEHGGKDVEVGYAHVASAFPSAEPNPCSFDEPMLDYRKLFLWAIKARWTVQPARTGQVHPPVRFIRIAGGSSALRPSDRPRSA